jgi:hypothetical protein
VTVFQIVMAGLDPAIWQIRGSSPRMTKREMLQSERILI